MIIDHNWDEVRQSMTDEIASVVQRVARSAINDIENRLREKGLDVNKMSKSKNKISFITDDTQEYEEGKVYFDEVYAEISRDRSWTESL